MVGLSQKLEEKRVELARLIERKAFDAYVRHGSVPDDFHQLAETAADGRKFLDLCAGLSVKALPDGRPTTHYTWRTAGDDRVRHTHAVLEGQVFAWTNAPSEGHPGTAPNCRCWAEPYYGNPALPDAFLTLQSERRASSNPTELWASIETLSRPDGSVAASHVRMTDGTSIQSTFSGPNTSQVVSLPDGGFYQLDSTGDTSQIVVGQNGQSAIKVAWLRQGLVPRLLPPPPAETITLPDYDPNVQWDVLVTPAALVLRGAAALYNLAVVAPKPMGLGEDDLPVLAFKVWSGKKLGETSTLALEVLTAEQVAQTCRSLPDVQMWTTQAATILMPQRSRMSASDWGTAVHFNVHGQVKANKALFPQKYATVFPEMTVLGGRDSQDKNGPRYGQSGASRLDVVEKVNPGLYCVMDIKTGSAGLTTSRMREILSKLPKDVQVFILEVRPFFMTTVAQVKVFAQPFLARHPDFIMVGRELIRLPIEHVVTGFNLQRTSLVTHIRTTWFSAPMFTPPFCSAGMGSENGITGGDIDDPLYPAKLLSELERTNSDLLDKIGTIQGILDHPHEPFYTFGIRPEAEAVLLTGLGRFSEARASLEELFAAERRASDAHRREIGQMQREGRKVWVWANAAGSWHEKREAHLKELLALLTQGEAGPIAALLHQWEAIKARELKLEKLWTPTPFAFEEQVQH